MKYIVLILCLISSPVFAKGDLFCMAEAMYFEARGEPGYGIGEISVGQVILNRVRSRHYPDNVCDVVYQRKQFSYYWDGKPERIRDRRSWVRALQLAKLVLAGAVYDPTYGATHYHADYVKPRWVKTVKYITKIGSHLFYKLGV